MLLALVLIPLPFALLCMVLPSSVLRRAALVLGAAAHFGATVMSWHQPVYAAGTLALDPLGHLFLTLISLLFLATAIYFVGYHQSSIISHQVFLACMLVLLSGLAMLCLAQHLGWMWVALETASLAATPLVYFRMGERALGATWKFLLMNSVGIALALLGIFAVGLSASAIHGDFNLTLSELIARAGQLDPTWLRAGFLLAIVGFGTKMGLAPLHSWKPDVYGEAPPPVAALLAGGMTLGAFLCMLRFVQIVSAAGQGEFASMWMGIFGVLSVVVAAIYILGNNDYRRLLAYTSVEHMGVLMLGASLGLAGRYATMLHAMHNTLNKGVLFFVAGFLWRTYHTNRTSDIRGAIHRHPVAAILLLGGLCATTALPPFGMFFSELGMVMDAINQQRWWTAGVFVLALAIVFVGVMTAMLPMALGSQNQSPAADPPAGWKWRKPLMLAPAAVLLLVAMGLGAYQPQPVRDALESAARIIAPVNPAVRTEAVVRVPLSSRQCLAQPASSATGTDDTSVAPDQSKIENRKSKIAQGEVP